MDRRSFLPTLAVAPLVVKQLIHNKLADKPQYGVYVYICTTFSDSNGMRQRYKVLDWDESAGLITIDRPFDDDTIYDVYGGDIFFIEKEMLT